MASFSRTFVPLSLLFFFCFFLRAESYTVILLSIEMSVLFKDDLRVVDNLNLPTDEAQFVKGTIAIQNFVKRASFPNELEIQRRKIEK